MSPARKLTIGGLLIAGLTAYVGYLGASASWRYYLTVDECAATASSLAGQKVRVSGRVTPGTLRIGADRKQAGFFLEGTSATLAVVCSGPFPANLAEDIEIVAEGRLDESGTLRADKLLTRCASKYVAKARAASPGAAMSKSLPQARAAQ